MCFSPYNKIKVISKRQSGVYSFDTQIEVISMN